MRDDPVQLPISLIKTEFQKGNPRTDNYLVMELEPGPAPEPEPEAEPEPDLLAPNTVIFHTLWCDLCSGKISEAF